MSSLFSSALSPTIQKFEKKVAESLEQGKTPGLAVVIVSRDHVHYLKGFGVKCLKFPDAVTPSSLFQLASVSKPLMSTALILLKEKGFCSLKAHPNHYLPDLFKGEAYKNLSLENMLNHTSGISYDGFEEMIESYVPRQIILEKLKNISPLAQPGEHYEYNNVVYGLIGDIMHTLTRQSLETVLMKYLFKPLKMDNACLGFPALLEAPDRAYPHEECSDGKLTPAAHYSHSYYIFPASAGVNACAKDLGSFIQLYLGKYPYIISKEELEFLYIPTTPAYSALNSLQDPRGTIKEVWYGLAWFLLNLGNERVVCHSGYINGARSFLGFLPDRDIGIAILTNTNHKIASQLGLEFFHLYLETLG